MGVRNRNKVQHHQQVQTAWTKNVVAILLFLLAAAMCVLLIVFWRSQQTPAGQLIDLRYWDKPDQSRFRSHLTKNPETYGLADKGQLARLTGKEQLTGYLGDWKIAKNSVSMIGIFGQAFLIDGKVVLRDAKSEPFDLVQEMINRAKEVPQTKLIALWDLGDGLKSETKFLSELRAQFEDAPENFWLIVSHSDGQVSRWLDGYSCTVFEAAVRQTVAELGNETDLTKFHERLQFWVSGLTVDCSGKALQTVPEVLCNKTQLTDVRWKWEKNNPPYAQLFDFQAAKVDEKPTGKNVLTLQELDSSTTQNLRIWDLPKEVRQQLLDKKKGNDSSSHIEDFGNTVVQLSCDIALCRFAFDNGLINQDNWERLKPELSNLEERYAALIPDSPAIGTLNLKLKPETLEDFSKSVSSFENKLEEAIKKSNGNGTPESVFHAQQMRLWNQLISSWEEKSAWPSADADDQKRTWPYKFSDSKLAEVTEPKSRIDAETWRSKDRLEFWERQASSPEFPGSLQPLRAWAWPNENLIATWQPAKILAPPVNLALETEPPAGSELKFNLAGEATINGKISFDHTPTGVVLEFNDDSLDFQWEIKPFGTDIAEVDSAASPKPPASRRATFPPISRSPDDPQLSVSGDYEFTVKLRSKNRVEPPLELKAVAKNPDGVPYPPNLGQWKRDYLKFDESQIKLHVQTSYPGSPGGSRPPSEQNNATGELHLTSLPNLVSEYKFWLTSSDYNQQNADRIDGVWRVQLRQGDVVLAEAPALFNSITGNRETPRYLQWTGKSKVRHFTEPLSLVISTEDRDIKKFKVKLTPKKLSSLIHDKVVPAEDWSDKEFLGLTNESVDPQINWKKYNEAWEGEWDSDSSKFQGDQLAKLRKEGVVVEYRVWQDRRSDGDIVRASGLDVVDFSKLKSGAVFPIKAQARNVFLIVSAYGWPQALRYYIDEKGVQFPQQELIGVFLQPKNCRFEPATSPLQQWAEPSDMKLYDEWKFFKLKSDAEGGANQLQIVVEDPAKPYQLLAVWYVNPKSAAGVDEGETENFFVRYEFDRSSEGKPFSLPMTTRLVWLGPLLNEADSSTIAICTRVLDSINAFPPMDLLKDRNNTDSWEFTLRKLQSGNLPESSGDGKTVTTLNLKSVPPPKNPE